MAELIYIENNEGLLFKGVAPGLPDERWSDKDKAFVKYDGGPKPEGWGTKISAAEAMKIMGF